jgi:UDP-GlcNAc3NAcA epimerase
MKLATILGARPQFIKASAVSRAISQHNERNNQHDRINEVIVHTGQHFDDNMSEVFFRQLQIPRPHYQLEINSLSHGAMTGQMLERIEGILLQEPPDMVLVYGDTNTTLAGALAAAKLHIPVAHVEAGLRSFNRKMAEELNRVVTDHLATLLFCPTSTAVRNLEKEGVTKGVHQSGDVMYDVFIFYKQVADKHSDILRTLSLRHQGYCLATVHRAENTEKASQLEDLFRLLAGLAETDLPFVIPLHPRTRGTLGPRVLQELSQQNGLCFIEPVGYIDMIALEVNAHTIFTDSGGVQKEAFFAGVPCITLRDETEWIETLENGWNQLTGLYPAKIKDAFMKRRHFSVRARDEHYGNGTASIKIIDRLVESYFG